MAGAKTFQWITCVVLVLWTRVDAGWVVPPTPTAPNTNQVISNRLLSYMNTEANPCQDFQKYAGGKYEDRHEEDNFSEMLGEIQGKVSDRLLSVFEDLKLKVLLDEASVEAKVSRFFQTCSTARNETRLKKHYLELVPPDTGLTWPQLHTGVWPKAKFEWMQTLGRLRRYGFDNLLIKMNVKLDYVDSTKYMVTIEMPSFDDSSERLGSITAIQKLLIKLGVRQNRAFALARSIKRLEKAVRGLTKVEEQPNDDLTLRELEAQNGFPWRQYLQIVFGRSFPSTFKVQIQNVDYFIALKRLLRAYDAEVIASYMMTRFVLFLDEASSSDSNDAQECIRDVRVLMDFGSNFLYESRFFDVWKQQQYDGEVQSLFNALRSTLLARIEANRLRLTTRKREFLKKKLAAMYVNVGNMPKAQDHRTFVTNFYRDLQLANDQDYAGAQLKVMEVRTRRVLELLDQPAVKGSGYYSLEDSLSTSLSPEPVYIKRENVIVLPYDVLQEPFFAPDSHDVFKVTVLGFMLAQTLMESIDAGNLDYDAEGNPSSAFGSLIENSQFDQATTCLNQKPTDYLGQRVVDVMALKLIYDTYFGVGSKYSQVQPSFTSLPLQQLFFVSYSQNLIGDDEYVFFNGQDSDKVRLSQTLDNLPAFATAFNCPRSNSQCEIW